MVESQGVKMTQAKLRQATCYFGQGVLSVTVSSLNQNVHVKVHKMSEFATELDDTYVHSGSELVACPPLFIEQPIRTSRAGERSLLDAAPRLVGHQHRCSENSHKKTQHSYMPSLRASNISNILLLPCHSLVAGSGKAPHSELPSLPSRLVPTSTGRLKQRLKNFQSVASRVHDRVLQVLSSAQG